MCGGEGGGEGRRRAASLIAKPEKVQLIQPPNRIIGRIFINVFFIMSVAMLVSVHNAHTRTRTHTRGHVVEHHLHTGSSIALTTHSKWGGNSTLLFLEVAIL